MGAAPTIRAGGAELILLLQPLWEALFDHHVLVGGAGLATIDRADSWLRRGAHYERLFAEQPWAAIWVAEDGGRAVGYALGYEDELEGSRAAVLETLSVLPEARGTGLGGELMGRLDARAGAEGVELGVVDVLGGNARARGLYLRAGYRPYSESWMRSAIPPGRVAASPAAVAEARLSELAAASGFDLEFSPGPDDTWVSSDRIAELSPCDPESAHGLAPGRAASLFAALETSGVWTLRVEIPAEPRAAALREALAAAGFRISTERLIRESSER